ncbi:glycosyltransferase [Bosea sp. 117]|uniref:glycosyltransferase n=1 Tax=Bosea sp. 117 TaxID=1125973 RepID=UPI0004946848|nr:glycosyltransferase [Bosea sp. 117]
MRIAHVVASIDPAHGGPQSGVVRLAAAQAGLGHHVRIVSHGDDALLRSALHAAAQVPHVDALEWTLLPAPGGVERIFGSRMRSRLPSLVAEADFVHLHGVWETLLRIAASCARQASTPYCLSPHGMLDRWSLAQKPWKKRLALQLGYRFMLEHAAFLQALNADEAELMGPLGLHPPVVVIPNGICPAELAASPEPGSFRRTVPGLGDRPFVLFLSRLHRKKGLDILAESFRMVANACPQLDLVVIGPEDGAGDAFRAQIRQLGLGARVHMAGPRFGAAKLAAYAEAVCFCLPSRQEGFSIAITEAMACGVPVVISEACHFPEVAAAGAGLVLPLDPARFAAALIDIAGAPEKAAAMGRNGRELIHAHYTWPQIAVATLAAYRAHARQTDAGLARPAAAARL